MTALDDFEQTLIVGERVNVRSPRSWVDEPLLRTIAKVERKTDAKGRTWLYWHWQPKGSIAAVDGRPFTDCGYSGVVIDTALEGGK